ncbi:Mechanosensitive ion channel-domain-containing protein [Sphaerosporella brunnea]|uniref:Mechanosensitive ion channel protein n=1 Tax=Sphaerosporella brunnea TaxID=1250544 RepID=A0A5J5EQA5_9PEZI|nr:Mechanosensitive ion channel-domain-containing protein [Sphaerosporella brunnea]
MARPPTSPRDEGFLPLHSNMNEPCRQPANDEHIINIPLAPITTNVSTSSRREGQTLADYPPSHTVVKDVPTDNMFRGRRRTIHESALLEEEGALTTMGRFYDKILHFSIITRYLVYIVPLGLCFLVPLLVSIFAAPNATIGGVRMLWFFTWLEIVWCSLWVSKLVSKAIPMVFQTLVGGVNSAVKKYSLVLKALELQLSFVGWAVASLCSFLPLMTRNRDLPPDRAGHIQDWQSRLNKVLMSCLVSSIIWLAEKLIIQIVSVDYHRRQFAQRIQTNKENVRLLASLLEVSRSLFPDFSEFAEEDYLIHAYLEIPGVKKISGSATPMRQFLGNVHFVQEKVVSVLGDIAHEVTGNKSVLNPTSCYALTVNALHRKKSAEALAKRIWMSFVPEGNYALTLADLKEVMGPELEAQAEECFRSFDRDDNGDVSLDEMILHTVQLHRERRDVAKSMQDVDNAISALDNVLSFVAFVIMVLIFVVAQQSSVGTTLAGAGTVLISLSFVFAITAQEVLGSCIFLFVKHPYDVGDRVDIDDQKFTVEHISLLYTVFKRVDTNKTTQIPNNILNIKTIENITRSKYIQEQLTVAVHYDTTVEDIQKLKHELLIFARENSRDFQPELEIEVVSINNLDKLSLRIDIKYRETITELLMIQRRNRFILAMVAIMKRIPIYAPGVGDPAVGEQGKPMYTVAISDEIARENMIKAAAEKLTKRWDYRDDSHDDDGVLGKSPASNTEAGHHVPSLFVDEFTPDAGDGNSTSSRREELEEVRGLLNRNPTQGRRKPAQTRPPNIGYHPQW